MSCFRLPHPARPFHKVSGLDASWSEPRAISLAVEISLLCWRTRTGLLRVPNTLLEARYSQYRISQYMEVCRTIHPANSWYIPDPWIPELSSLPPHRPHHRTLTQWSSTFSHDAVIHGCSTRMWHDTFSLARLVARSKTNAVPDATSVCTQVDGTRH